MTQVIFPFLRTAEMFSGIFCFWGVKDQSFFPLNEKLLCFLFHVRLCCRSYTVKEVCPPLQNRAAPPSFSVIAHSFYTTFAEEFDIQLLLTRGRKGEGKAQLNKGGPELPFLVPMSPEPRSSKARAVPWTQSASMWITS